jgi:DNA-binding transcriptional MocR family regulator
MFLYQQLAAQLAAKIQAQQLHSGDKLLSIRGFARQQQISLNTAKACYQLLESQGLIFAKPQSGYVVQFRDDRKPNSPSHSFASYARKISNLDLMLEIQQASASPQAVQLGTIQLDRRLIPLASLKRSLNRVTKHATAEDFLLCHRQGHPQLIRALAEHWREDGIYIPEQQIVISSGCMPALATLVQTLSQDNDSIIVTSPNFNGQLQMLANMQRKIIEIPADQQGIDLQRLEQVMQSGVAKILLITANYHNPLGFALGNAQKQQLAELAARYRCFILEDDIFAECGHQQHRPLPIKFWDQAGYVIWCGSVAKSLSPAYRVGWFCLGQQTEAFKSLLFAHNQLVSTPLQLALADLIYSRAYREHLQHLRAHLPQQVMDYVAYVRAVFAELLLSCRMPEGGYVLWLELLPQIDSRILYQRAQQCGICIVPGFVFSEDGRHKHFIRLNAGLFLDQHIKTALEQLAQCGRELAIQNSA